VAIWGRLDEVSESAMPLPLHRVAAAANGSDVPASRRRLPQILVVGQPLQPGPNRDLLAELELP
jgi:hypothetical protein